VSNYRIAIQPNDLEATTSTCFKLTMLALTQTDIRHRHRHRGGLSKNTTTDQVANSCHRNNTKNAQQYTMTSVQQQRCPLQHQSITTTSIQSVTNVQHQSKQNLKPGSVIFIVYFDTSSQVCPCVCEEIVRTKSAEKKLTYL